MKTTQKNPKNQQPTSINNATTIMFTIALICFAYYHSGAAEKLIWPLLKPILQPETPEHLKYAKEAIRTPVLVAESNAVKDLRRLVKDPELLERILAMDLTEEELELILKKFYGLEISHFEAILWDIVWSGSVEATIAKLERLKEIKNLLKKDPLSKMALAIYQDFERWASFMKLNNTLKEQVFEKYLKLLKTISKDKAISRAILGKVMHFIYLASIESITDTKESINKLAKSYNIEDKIINDLQDFCSFFEHKP